MKEAVEHAPTHRAQHIAERRTAREVDPEHQLIDEEPDEPLRRGMGAAGQIGADDQIILAAAVAQHDEEGGKSRHEQRSEEHTSELQSLMRISYAVFCLTKKTKRKEG